MNGWSRIWWGTAGLAALAQAGLLHVGRLVEPAPSTGVIGPSGAWFGQDVPGYDVWSRSVYGLPEAWSVLGFVLVAVSVALWRESRTALVAAAPALVTALVPTHGLAISAALVATSVLAMALARSAPSRALRIACGSVGAALLLFVVVGAGSAPSRVEDGSTADLVGRLAAPVLLVVVALVLAAGAVAPRQRSTTADESVEARVQRSAWALASVAAAVQLALIGADVVERLPDPTLAWDGARSQTVTVAIAQFTGAERPPPIDLVAHLPMVGILTAAAAAVAALLLRRVHPVVFGALGCFALAVLPVGTGVRSALGLAGFAILGFVALRQPQELPGQGS